MPSTVVPALTVRVLLFASYADALGLDSVELSLTNPATVGDVLDRLRALPGGDRLPPKPLCALNLTHVRSDAPLSRGDELAILPPLAGG
ncbi:MAG TPA: MoaD/ThiS family protein [Gemmatimonadales bacterium]|nr:MoaD/ThiS family protein [Gemmatimonadales bacterium]